jgi:hypothetical protein
VTFRSEAVSDGKETTLRLSGSLQAEHLDLLADQIESHPATTLIDLEEITLIGLEGIRFLAHCERSGIELRNCPPFVRVWIAMEQDP